MNNIPLTLFAGSNSSSVKSDFDIILNYQTHKIKSMSLTKLNDQKINYDIITEEEGIANLRNLSRS